jgi:hypothetical protein
MSSDTQEAERTTERLQERYRSLTFMQDIHENISPTENTDIKATENTDLAAPAASQRRHT